MERIFGLTKSREQKCIYHFNDHRPNRGFVLTNEQDIIVDEESCASIQQEIRQGNFDWKVKYFGVTPPEYWPDKNGFRSCNNCINTNYRNYFFLEKSWVEMYIMPPSR